MRPQGLWFLNLNIATQMLARWNDPEIAAIADQRLGRHHEQALQPRHRSEYGDVVFRLHRPKEESAKSRIGHGVEALWMVMDEADRRKDAALWRPAPSESVAIWMWVGTTSTADSPSGSTWITRVTNGRWRLRRGPVLEFRFTGEYEYMKTRGR